MTLHCIAMDCEWVALSALTLHCIGGFALSALTLYCIAGFALSALTDGRPSTSVGGATVLLPQQHLPIPLLHCTLCATFSHTHPDPCVCYERRSAQQPAQALVCGAAACYIQCVAELGWWIGGAPVWKLYLDLYLCLYFCLYLCFYLYLYSYLSVQLHQQKDRTRVLLHPFVN